MGCQSPSKGRTPESTNQSNSTEKSKGPLIDSNVTQPQLLMKVLVNFSRRFWLPILIGKLQQANPTGRVAALFRLPPWSLMVSVEQPRELNFTRGSAAFG